MTCRVVIAAEADEQLSSADRWWRTNRPATADLLLEEFEEAVRLLSTVPEIGPRFRRAALPGVRRILLPKTSHWVYYVYDPSHSLVLVLAVWSAHRGSGPPLR